MSSTFKVEVVRLGEIEPHPNADTLGVTHIWGYQAIVKLGDWEEGQLAAYIPPDSVVPDTEQFAFLGGHRHIKVRRLRGLYSMGLLMPAPDGSQVGDDVAEQMGIVHYEPEFVSVESEPPPSGFKPTYDVEHLLRYDTLFSLGEEVIATEKLDGENSRFTFQDGRLWAASRKEWIAYNAYKPSGHWRVLADNPAISKFLKQHEGKYTLYGELYGWVQSLRYGHLPGDVSIRFFDLWDEPNTRWVDHDRARSLTGFSPDLWVPEVYRGPFYPHTLASVAEGNSVIPGANHRREGIVIKPIHERLENDLGGRRLQLKLINPEFLEKGK